MDFGTQYLARRHTHKHTLTVCDYIKCSHWARIWVRRLPFEELLWMLCFGPCVFSGEHLATPTHTQTRLVLTRQRCPAAESGFPTVMLLCFYLTANNILYGDREKTLILLFFCFLGAQENFVHSFIFASQSSLIPQSHSYTSTMGVFFSVLFRSGLIYWSVLFTQTHPFVKNS